MFIYLLYLAQKFFNIIMFSPLFSQSLSLLVPPSSPPSSLFFSFLLRHLPSINAHPKDLYKSLCEYNIYNYYVLRSIVAIE